MITKKTIESYNNYKNKIIEHIKKIMELKDARGESRFINVEHIIGIELCNEFFDCVKVQYSNISNDGYDDCIVEEHNIDADDFFMDDNTIDKKIKDERIRLCEIEKQKKAEQWKIRENKKKKLELETYKKLFKKYKGKSPEELS